MPTDLCLQVSSYHGHDCCTLFLLPLSPIWVLHSLLSLFGLEPVHADSRNHHLTVGIILAFLCQSTLHLKQHDRRNNALSAPLTLDHSAPHNLPPSGASRRDIDALKTPDLVCALAKFRSQASETPFPTFVHFYTAVAAQCSAQYSGIDQVRATPVHAS